MEKTQQKYAAIVMSCVEDKFLKTEAVWEYNSLMRIVSGEMKIVLATMSYVFNAGDTVLIPRNQLSMVIKRPKDGQPYKSILVTLRPERLKDYYAKRKFQHIDPINHTIQTFNGHPLLESFFTSLLPYFDLQNKLPDEISNMKIEESIAILRTIDKGVDALLADFTEPGKINLAEFMEKNFMFNMSLEKFGNLTGRSIATFHRDFKKAFNATPQKWIIQKRLELAHYQLSEKKRRPIDVYLEVGFENLSHFSFSFKKYFGYSPTLFSNDK